MPLMPSVMMMDGNLEHRDAKAVDRADQEADRTGRQAMASTQGCPSRIMVPLMAGRDAQRSAHRNVDFPREDDQRDAHRHDRVHHAAVEAKPDVRGREEVRD